MHVVRVVGPFQPVQGRIVLAEPDVHLSDQEGEVKYTAAATALRLIAIRQAREVGKEREQKQK